jgi:hypothetical protein
LKGNWRDETDKEKRRKPVRRIKSFLKSVSQWWGMMLFHFCEIFSREK